MSFSSVRPTGYGVPPAIAVISIRVFLIVLPDFSAVLCPEVLGGWHILYSRNQCPLSSERFAGQQQRELHIGNGLQIQFVLVSDLRSTHVQARHNVWLIALNGPSQRVTTLNLLSNPEVVINF